MTELIALFLISGIDIYADCDCEKFIPEPQEIIEPMTEDEFKDLRILVNEEEIFEGLRFLLD